MRLVEFLCAAILLCQLAEGRDRSRDHHVGNHRCTRGPAFWCKSLSNAKQCGHGALVHCQKYVWKANKPGPAPAKKTTVDPTEADKPSPAPAKKTTQAGPVEGFSTCKPCLVVVSTLKKLSLKGAAKDVLSKVCKVTLIKRPSLKKRCDDIVNMLQIPAIKRESICKFVHACSDKSDSLGSITASDSPSIARPIDDLLHYFKMSKY